MNNYTKHTIRVKPFKFREGIAFSTLLENARAFSALLNEFKFLKKDDKAKEFVAIHEQGYDWNNFFYKLKKFSRLYPNTTFSTEAERLTNTELYRCHIRDGELQYAEVLTFNPEESTDELE